MYKFRNTILFLLILLFIVIELLFIKFPVHPNFVIDLDTGAMASIARSIGKKAEYSYLVPYHVIFLDRIFPIMVIERHGALELYLTYPFLLCFGNNIEALRIAAIFWGVIIIILTYYFVSNMFNVKIALLVILLLALNSNFINFMRWWSVFGFTMPVFTVTSLLLFWNYLKTKKEIFFYFGMFILSLGLNAKGWFIWFIIALIMSSVIQWRKLYLSIKTISVGFLFFILGISPIIYFNIKSKGALISFLYRNLHITGEGINNLQFVKNLFIRIAHLTILINRDIYTGGCLGFLKNFPFLFLALTIIGTLYLAVVKKRTVFSRDRILFILSLAVFTFFLSVFTATTFYPGHLYILLPFLQILLAVGIYELFAFFRQRIFKIFLSFMLFTLLTAEIGKCFASYKIYKDIKEINKGSSEYDIAAWLSIHKQKNKIIWCDYVWPAYIFFLYDNITPFQVKSCYFNHKKSNDIEIFSKEIITEIEDSRNTFIFVNVDESFEYKVFINLVGKLGKKIFEEKKFVNNKGETKFLICSLK